MLPTGTRPLVIALLAGVAHLACSSATAGSAPDASVEGGTVACGCHGRPGCAEWRDVYVTWYGFNDNSCGTEAQHGCDNIASPGLGPRRHTGATAGAGTYDDPSTAAASHTTDPGHSFERSGGVTLAPGTMIYNPEVEQYFIMEDSCLECGDEYACKLSAADTDDPPPPAACTPDSQLHIDFWMGPSGGAQPGSLQRCEANATLGAPYAGTGVVLINPPDNLPVRRAVLYGDGGCFTSRQASPVSCP